MNDKKLTGANLESWMEMLASKDGMVRQKARKALVALGKPAAPSLAKALQNSALDQVRWEAAKALSEIGDTRSIPALVKALEDSDFDVAWVAAEALIKFKRTAWPALLRALMKAKKDADSILLRQGAHHVLRNQRAAGFNDLLKALRDALESNAAPESAPVAAFDLLKQIKEKQ